MPVAALGIGTGKTVEDSGFRDFEVWQPQHRFRGTSFRIALLILLHHPWPPPPRADHALLTQARSGWRVTRPDLGTLPEDRRGSEYERKSPRIGVDGVCERPFRARG